MKKEKLLSMREPEGGRGGRTGEDTSDFFVSLSQAGDDEMASGLFHQQRQRRISKLVSMKGGEGG